jgi:hypothetical protein
MGRTTAHIDQSGQALVVPDLFIFCGQSDKWNAEQSLDYRLWVAVTHAIVTM